MPAGVGDDDPLRVAATALRSVERNRTWMDDPPDRRLGLPISSAPVKSVIKRVNRRVTGGATFWLRGAAEVLLQVRAASWNEDDRVER